MTEPEASPFSRKKSNHWIWIVPSVLLHVIVLAIWLLLPEPDPRKPGERELKIKPEQAKQLQKHVEEANLEVLRAQVAELQKIKQAMAGIRAQEMEQVSAFEQTMVKEAPRDIATLLSELAGIYESVHKHYQGIQETIDPFRAQTARVRKIAKEDTASGIRSLKQFRPLYDHFDGLYDKFEVAFYESGAKMNAVEVKLEWINDPSLGKRIEALKPAMEKTRELHGEAWRAIPYNWKRARSFSDLTENTGERIETLRTFRKKHKKQLDRTTYRPDGKMVREVQRIEQRLDHALPEPPDKALIDRAMKQQQEMVRRIEKLAESLEAAP